jgi:hypothetical protein
MTEQRSVDQRRADVLALLKRNGDLWLATAGPAGRPHLIVVATWWGGSQLVVATVGSSLTARNLGATGRGRLAGGSTDDVVMIDARVASSLPVAEADESRSGFITAAGWDPAEEGDDWRFFRLEPVRVQAYRGYGELQGREVMRGGRWLR